MLLSFNTHFEYIMCSLELFFHPIESKIIDMGINDLPLLLPEIVFSKKAE